MDRIMPARRSRRSRSVEPALAPEPAPAAAAGTTASAELSLQGRAAGPLRSPGNAHGLPPELPAEEQPDGSWASPGHTAAKAEWVALAEGFFRGMGAEGAARRWALQNAATQLGGTLAALKVHRECMGCLFAADGLFVLPSAELQWAGWDARQWEATYRRWAIGGGAAAAAEQPACGWEAYRTVFPDAVDVPATEGVTGHRDGAAGQRPLPWDAGGVDVASSRGDATRISMPLFLGTEAELERDEGEHLQLFTDSWNTKRSFEAANLRRGSFFAMTQKGSDGRKLTPLISKLEDMATSAAAAATLPSGRPILTPAAALEFCRFSAGYVQLPALELEDGGRALAEVKAAHRRNYTALALIEALQAGAKCARVLGQPFGRWVAALVSTARQVDAAWVARTGATAGKCCC
jgi:hypothetical protein